MDVFRVLAVAYKSLQARPTYSKEEESELILKGYVAFLDPPKETAEKAIAALKKKARKTVRQRQMAPPIPPFPPKTLDVRSRFLL
jgi:magnesium-transporting ATPase (P-type)